MDGAEVGAGVVDVGDAALWGGGKAGLGRMGIVVVVLWFELLGRRAVAGVFGGGVVIVVFDSIVGV